jgi:hypothetical protein
MILNIIMGIILITMIIILSIMIITLFYEDLILVKNEYKRCCDEDKKL